MDIYSERLQRGKELRELRKRKGVTQKKMAEISGVSLPSILRMEKAKNNWRIDLELIFRLTLSKMPDTHYLNDERKWRPLKLKEKSKSA